MTPLKPVALISMPTLSARFPSFQLALLKPTLEREGIPVQTFSLFMYFGTQVGWRLNETLPPVELHFASLYAWTFSSVEALACIGWTFGFVNLARTKSRSKEATEQRKDQQVTLQPVAPHAAQVTEREPADGVAPFVVAVRLLRAHAQGVQVRHVPQLKSDHVAEFDALLGLLTTHVSAPGQSALVRHSLVSVVEQW